MKKIIALIVAIVVILGIVWYGRKPANNNPVTVIPTNSITSTTSAPVPVTETIKVSSKTSKLENAELGFAVNYPSAWEVSNTNAGALFVMPTDKNQVSTIGTLQAEIKVLSGKCAFPPVTTIKDRGTVKIENITANMISMSNTVQGRSYFNRMYSLQKGDICYMFSFESVTLSPESKGLTGSNATQAKNNNKAIVSTADADFINMTKSFTFIESATGQDETKVAPAK